MPPLNLVELAADAKDVFSGAGRGRALELAPAPAAMVMVDEEELSARQLGTVAPLLIQLGEDRRAGPAGRVNGGGRQHTARAGVADGAGRHRFRVHGGRLGCELGQVAAVETG